MNEAPGRCRRGFHLGFAIAAGVCVASAGLLVIGCGFEAKDEQGAAIARGAKLYEVSCGSCHRASGSGAQGVAAPLAGSPWVVGSAERLVRIALHGVRGPIEVNGRTFNLEMPGFQHVFRDEDMAAILTHARQAWGNDAPAIEPQVVAAIRASEAERGDSWTAEELMAW